jgi:uncharacterized damage-inducible protein DinB
MVYEHTAIDADRTPRASSPIFQHIVDTYASETNKVVSVWRDFTEDDLAFRIAPKSSSVAEIMKHQILSERRFFAEFLASDEPPVPTLLAGVEGVEALATRMRDLALPRLPFLASRDEAWWLSHAKFFDVDRERIWIFWRRVLHTAHHRTQLTLCLRALGKPVPSTYGPTADVTWKGADPTLAPRA